MRSPTMRRQVSRGIATLPRSADTTRVPSSSSPSICGPARGFNRLRGTQGLRRVNPFPWRAADGAAAAVLGREAVTIASNSLKRVAGGLATLGLLVSSCRLQPSRVPLGGEHVDEQAELEATRRAAQKAASSALPSAPIEEAPHPPALPTPAEAAAATSQENPKPSPGNAAFEPRPFAIHQTWTRLFDLEFNLKVGPSGSIDMNMVSHQEARFEVLGVTNGTLDKLGIEYAVYTSKLTIMGATQDSPEELAGKRFVVTFNRDKPDVRDAGGGTPPKKQIDSVNDDAREPLEIEKALRELARLAGNGRGDFSSAGAIALAGGEDEDTKVPSAKASLRQVIVGAHAEKSALLDLGYTLTNVLEDRSVIEVQVAGTMSVLDAPGRYQSSTLQGPMELRSAEPGGMQGRGTIKVTTSYKY
jgi:hypothetical protein